VQGGAAPRLRALAAEATGELNVFGHDGDALGVDASDVGVLKQRHEIRLGGLLERQDRGALEAEIVLETAAKTSSICHSFLVSLLSNLADEALERQLANQQIRGLLHRVGEELREVVGAKVPGSDGSRAVQQFLGDSDEAS
jgi:hypothetical protein